MCGFSAIYVIIRIDRVFPKKPYSGQQVSRTLTSSGGIDVIFVLKDICLTFTVKGSRSKINKITPAALMTRNEVSAKRSIFKRRLWP